MNCSPNLLQFSNFLFDLDGTLVDSNSAHSAAFREALSETAPDALSRFNYSEFRGWATVEVCKALGVADAASTVRRKQSAYLREVAVGEIAFFPLALELVRFLYSLRKNLYLVTSASTQAVGAILHRGEIFPLFSGIVDCSEQVASKPAPDLYQRCLAKYSIAKASALAIEDSPSGVASAMAAGLTTVAVNGDTTGATYSFTTIGDMFKLLEKSAEHI